MIRTLLAAGLLTASLTPAHAAGPVPDGNWFTCGFTVVDDPAVDDDGVTLIGEADLPAIVLVDPADPFTEHRGSATCTVQVEAPTHREPDTVAGTGPTGRVVTVPPTPFPLVVQPGQYWYGCTQVDVAGGPTYYFDDVTGTWSTDPDAFCALAISA
jgi:hypothetical protein